MLIKPDQRLIVYVSNIIKYMSKKSRNATFPEKKAFAGMPAHRTGVGVLGYWGIGVLGISGVQKRGLNKRGFELSSEGVGFLSGPTMTFRSHIC